MSNEAKIVAIQMAQTIEGLTELWSEWEARGWSRDGLMYARVLERKAQLGELTAEEERHMESVKERAEHGESLPPISVNMGRRTGDRDDGA